MGNPFDERNRYERKDVLVGKDYVVAALRSMRLRRATTEQRR